MKKYLLLLSLLICFNINAQLSFINSSLKEVHAVSDSILKHFEYKQIFNSEKSSKYTLDIEYMDETDNARRTIIRWRIIYPEENKDLEIKGEPNYVFSYIQGRYIDLFSFWKSHVNINEDEKQLTQKGATYILKNNYKFVFSRSASSGLWTISMKEKFN